ncbi:titin isoform X2 [Trichomycterus rosablanca]|uniref:titin isoform X2 n=1 Tax=Trichomycterus rosablanca TaxID=2290929 RepID=UPI002F350B20
MERKMMNLGRAKKKLRYFQTEENSSCQVKIKELLTMQDLDNIFDDLDSSGPGTPLLSPLPKTPGLDEQVTGSNSVQLKPPLLFTENISPLKASDALVAEIDIHTEHLNGKESLLDVIAPITTSSPIELLTVEVVTEETERPDTTPLLFVEDEEPIGGDLIKPTSNHRAESPEEILQGESDSLVSPPARLEFVKHTKNDDLPETRESISVCLQPHQEFIKPTKQDNVPVTRDGETLLSPAAQTEIEPMKEVDFVPLSDSESLVSPPARMELKKPTDPDLTSESEVAPPARMELKKPTKQHVVPVTSSTPLKVLDAVVHQPQTVNAPRSEEPEEFQKEESPGVSSSVSVRNSQPESVPEGNLNSQAPELGLEVEGKEPSFQQKLFSALQLRMKSCRKSQPVKCNAPSPLVSEDDFMILDDDAPIRFVIPKKTESGQKGKPAPEHSAKKKALNSKSASPKRTEEAQKGKGIPGAVTQNTKTKRGKNQNIGTREDAAPAAADRHGETLTEASEELGTAQSASCLTEQSKQKVPTAGRRKTKGKTNTEQLGTEQRKAAGDASKKPATPMKKSAKLPMNRQDEPAEHVKKKPNKVKPTNKESSSESECVGTAKLKKNSKDRTVTRMRKNRETEAVQECVDEIQGHTGPHLEDSNIQPEGQNTTTVEKIPKQPLTKPPASKKPARVKKTEKAKEALKIKELPVPESDVSAEASLTSKRKRKPPGDWWLSQQQQEHSPQEHRDTVQHLELKPNKKTGRKAPAVVTDSTEQRSPRLSQKSQNKERKPESVREAPKNLKKSRPDTERKNAKAAGGRRKPKAGAPSQHEMSPDTRRGEEAEDDAAAEQPSPVHHSSPRWRSSTPGDKRLFAKTYTRDSVCESAQKRPPAVNKEPEIIPEKRQRRAPSNWWEVPEAQEPVERPPLSQNRPSVKSRPQMIPPDDVFRSVASPQKTAGPAQKRNKMNVIKTPKSFKRSLAAFDALLASGKTGSSTVKGLKVKQKGRRKLLHSLEDQSEQSSENILNDEQQQGSSYATFDVCASGVTTESDRKKTNARFSSGSNRAYDDTAFRSGPSSMIELERFEEHDLADLPSSRTVTQAQPRPRFLSDCGMCGSPLKPVTLEVEDWDNICVWFNHIWPAVSKTGRVISIDDFHWHCHAGRAMGHMIDLQDDKFSSGKILLGSYMKKPEQVDHNAVTVFNVNSSCVRVEIDGVMQVYNAGCTFMTPRGKSYSIHNVCREPAVLWYHRMLSNCT